MGTRFLVQLELRRGILVLRREYVGPLTFPGHVENDL
jgi:hypothetical protein